MMIAAGPTPAFHNMEIEEIDRETSFVAAWAATVFTMQMILSAVKQVIG
jgi:hypothetical protein